MKPLVFHAHEAVVDLQSKESQYGPYIQGTANNNVDIPSFYINTDSYAFFNGSDFKLIFGRKRGECLKYKTGRHLPIVKITRNVPIGGKGKTVKSSIYREFRDCHALKGQIPSDEHYVALPYLSLLALSKDNEDFKQIDEVVISEANAINRILYYWNHPNHTTRVAMKVGILSLIVGVIGIVIGIVKWC